MDRFHVRVGVLVEQLQEEGEVLRVTLVGRRSQKQQVVSAVAQKLPEPIALTLVGLVAGRHAVGLVHDHQIPLRLLQAGKDLLALGEVQRRDHLVLAQPLVDAELVADVAPLEHDELLLELLLQLPLPLEAEVRGAHHEDALDQTAQLEFADEEACHDRLTGAGVVRQEEPHTRELHEVFVDRLKLVGQRINLGDGQAEVGIELVGDPERKSL